MNWVRDGIEHAQLLLKERTDPTASNCTVFWLRLNGIFSDVEPWARATRDEVATPDDPGGYNPRHNLISDVIAHIEQLRAVFTDDELIWIEYMRHTQAHPTPHAFDHAVLKDGQVRRDYPAAALGQRVLLTDFNDTITRVYESYRRDEKGSAVAFAQRAMAALPGVHTTLQCWAFANS